MAFGFGRILRALAPDVCQMCEGGSGLTRDASRPVLRRCASCDGTGIAAGESLAEMQHRLDAALFQRRQAPVEAPRKAA